jgi:hypothetical protein
MFKLIQNHTLLVNKKNLHRQKFFYEIKLNIIVYSYCYIIQSSMYDLTPKIVIIWLTKNNKLPGLKIQE